MNNEKIFFYNETVMIWEQLCKLHSQLYDITCEEYMCLLSSEVDKVEDLVQEKQGLIGLVGELNNARSELMKDMNKTLGPTSEITKASELIKFFKEFENENHNSTLQRLNLLLIDIIEKIQEQNKKNQVFINKAINSLSEMKLDLGGKKKYKTYNQSGKTTVASGP